MIKGFKMWLKPGAREEYEKRHRELWPEMAEMIRSHGGKNYSIFWDAQTNVLFATLEIESETLWDEGSRTAINRKWWDYMADLMEVNGDNSPKTEALELVFHLP